MFSQAFATVALARLDHLGNHPAVLADLAVADEPEPLVRRQSAVEEKAGGNGACVLRVALHRPAADSRRKRRCCAPPVPSSAGSGWGVVECPSVRECPLNDCSTCSRFGLGMQGSHGPESHF
jgi:hypothetical protein